MARSYLLLVKRPRSPSQSVFLVNPASDMAVGIRGRLSISGGAGKVVPLG